MADRTELAEAKFVSLTTYKKSGEGVATPMWIAADGADLVAWTPADSWKVKRVRRDGRVALAPCGRSGAVADGVPKTVGTAVVDDSPAEVARVEGLVKGKYGLQFRIVTLVERLLARGRKPRAVLRITIDG